jgi:hypothetical protein
MVVGQKLSDRCQKKDSFTTLSPGQAEFELQAKHPAREVDQERAGCKLINFKQGVEYF